MIARNGSTARVLAVAGYVRRPDRSDPALRTGGLVDIASPDSLEKLTCFCPEPAD